MGKKIKIVMREDEEEIWTCDICDKEIDERSKDTFSLGAQRTYMETPKHLVHSECFDKLIEKQHAKTKS